MQSHKLLKHLPTVLALLAIIAAVLLALFLKKLFFKEEITQRKMVQEITVITPPPPPPPPPEQEPEPEVEEEVIEEEMEEPTPDDTPDEPASESLGVDADGEAGSDVHGLVGRKGGRSLLGGGGYGSFVKSEINKAMIKDKVLRQLVYKAKVTLWIEDDGSFLRYSVQLLEGDENAKSALEKLLRKMGGLSRAKPFEEDSRFTLRITSVI